MYVMYVLAELLGSFLTTKKEPFAAAISSIVILPTSEEEPLIMNIS